MNEIDTTSAGAMALGRQPTADLQRRGAGQPGSARRWPWTSLAVLGVAGLLLGMAWQVRSAPPYQSGDGLGYLLGLAGGLVMLALLVYPVRKRVRRMHGWGPLKHWFRFHMLAGIGGPVLVLFHSTFRVGSVNAAVALASLALVVASGLVGRFLYRRIHRGLYGAQESLPELERSMQAALAALEPALARTPAVRAEVERFTARVMQRPHGALARYAQGLTLGWRRLQVRWRLRRALRTPGGADVRAAEAGALLHATDQALAAVQRHAQFSTFERLFSLWHVVHIPFLWMLVFTAVVHVVAVHAY